MLICMIYMFMYMKSWTAMQRVRIVIVGHKDIERTTANIYMYVPGNQYVGKNGSITGRRAATLLICCLLLVSPCPPTLPLLLDDKIALHRGAL